MFFVPTATFPNWAVSGVAATYPALRETPSPVNDTATVPLAALLISFSVPADVPAFCGVNFTVNVMVDPACSQCGSESPCTLYPLPVTVSPDSRTPEFPVFAMVTLTVCARPTATCPKFTAPGANCNSPLARAAGAMPAPITANTTTR